MKTYKLNFEMIPETCWRDNLRKLLTQEQWDRIRKDAYKRSGWRCACCGERGRLEAHEHWSYDEELALQKLETVVALCRRCHEVAHIGRTYAVGRGDEAMEQFMKVNACSQMEYHAALAFANEEYARLSKIENWVTDMTWLEKQGIAPTA